MSEQPVLAPEVDLATFAEVHADGATLLDVRSVEEYTEAHVPGAVLVPLPELGERLADLPEGRPLYVICAMGGRSRAAADALVSQAGIEAVNVAGGTKAWMESGRPVHTGLEP